MFRIYHLFVPQFHELDLWVFDLHETNINTTRMTKQKRNWKIQNCENLHSGTSVLVGTAIWSKTTLSRQYWFSSRNFSNASIFWGIPLIISSRSTPNITYHNKKKKSKADFIEVKRQEEKSQNYLSPWKPFLKFFNMFLHFSRLESLNETVWIDTNWKLFLSLRKLISDIRSSQRLPSQKSTLTYCSNTSKPPIILYSFRCTLKSHYTSTRTHKVSCIIISMKPIITKLMFMWSN